MNRTALWRSAITLLIVAILLPPGLWLNRRIQRARDVAYFRSLPEGFVTLETRSEIDEVMLQSWLTDDSEPWILPLFETPVRLVIDLGSELAADAARPPLNFQRIERFATLTDLTLRAPAPDDSTPQDIRPTAEVDLKFLKSLSQLQRLEINNLRLTNSRLRPVAHLSHLKALWLNGMGLSDADLAALRAPTNLQYLSLAGNPITDEGAAFLAGLVELQQLDLRATKVTGETIPHLARLLRLSIIVLPDELELSDDNLAILSELPLDHLTIKSRKVTAAGLRHVGRMSKLKGLDIQNITVSGEDLAPLANLHLLEGLDLPPSPRLGGCLKYLVGLNLRFDRIPQVIVTDNDLSHFITIKSRFGKRYLNLSQSQVTDVGLEALRGKPQIHQVDISQTRVTDAGLLPLTTMPDLKLLVLRQTGVTDKGLETIARLSALELLDLSETLVTDAGLPHLAGLKRLDMLNLSKTAVTDAGLRAVAELKSLSWLNLDETKITDAGLETLAGLPNLTKLELSGTSITDAGLEHLLKCPKLRTLKLNRTKVTDAGFRKFAGLTNLKDIEVDGTSVTPGWVEIDHTPIK